MLRPFILIAPLLVMLPAMAAETAPAPAMKAESRKSRPAPDKPQEQERITILSIIPAQGEPGVTVTLSGNGISQKASAYLGSTEIPGRLVGQKQLSFEIPRIAPGLYALFVKNLDGSTSKTYSFNVQPLKPIATSLSPDTVPACTMAGSREVVVNGRNFQEGAQILFDGGAIRSRYLSGESISFTVPAVRGGMHQIQVRNPEDTTSTSLGLLIDSRPEIMTIIPGADYVNYYELAIEGRNFQQGSMLVVDGRRISGGLPTAGERDRVIYMGCTQLIYQRYPADPTPHPLRLQVVNPDNEESPVVTVNTP